MPRGGGKLISGAENVGEMALNQVTGTVSKFQKTIVENKGIAVGFMVGVATLAFIKSMVDDLFMPFLAPVLGDDKEEWKKKKIHAGPIVLEIGQLVSSFITYFVTIIAIYVFIHMVEM